MTSHLRLRNGHYYFRLRIPTDLLSTIPEPEILKSLRTKDRKSARVAASCLLPGILQVFTLTRTGFISPGQATERLDVLLGRTTSAVQALTPRHSDRPAEKPSPTLSQIITEYIKDKQFGWTEKTLGEYQSYFKLLQDVLKIETIADINRVEVRRLRDSLCRLPAHLYRKYPGKSIEQILEMDNITPMSTNTINKLLTLFGSIMLHCVKEGHINSNPVEGLKIPRKNRPDEERKVYTTEDLDKIVAALPEPADKPERHWIPLIGMFSGMRMGEICGLHIEDVKQVDGIWCFNVDGEDDKRLKTLSSKRIVPVHPYLIEGGFLSFVDALRGNGIKRLWPNLKRRGTDGYCHAIGKWFQRFNRMHITTDPLKTFHSLRHTFADTLKQQGEQEALISELMGHANHSITTGRYGKRYKPQMLLEAVSRISVLRAASKAVQGKRVTGQHGPAAKPLP
jgi:integrase